MRATVVECAMLLDNVLVRTSARPTTALAKTLIVNALDSTNALASVAV